MSLACNVMRSFLRKSASRRASERKSVKASAAPAEFKPSFQTLLICDNGQDNVPEAFVDAEGQPNETVAFISQSRSPGHKNVGQDAIGLARYGNWDIKVLCDGHDRDGHEVARAVCDAMPETLLRLMSARSDPDSVPSEELIKEAFREVSDTVCWTGEDVHPGMFVKCFGGKWEGRVGFLAEVRDINSAVLVVVDEDGYHRPMVERKFLKRPKYTGGTTCVVTLHNTYNGTCRIAQTGDSRIMIFNMKIFEDSFLQPVFGLSEVQSKHVPPMAIGSPAHSVFNPSELLRLNTDYAGAFEIDGAFLVNPLTKFSIQPTRGIGDFDVYGTGYISVPEVSSPFVMSPGSILLMASDGIFDEHVIKADELVTFFSDHFENSTPLYKMATDLYDETLQRSLAGGYVDDISLILYRAPELDGPAPLEALESHEDEDFTGVDDGDVVPDFDEAAAAGLEKTSSGSKSGNARRSLLGGLMKTTLGKKSKSKREIISLDDERLATKPDIPEPSPEDRRRTIERSERAGYSDLVQEALKSQEQEEATEAAEETLRDADAAESEEIAQAILARYAKRYGHSPEEVLASANVSKDAANIGRRVSASMERRALFDEEDDGTGAKGTSKEKSKDKGGKGKKDDYNDATL